MGRTANEISGLREAGDHPARRAIPSTGSAGTGSSRDPEIHSAKAGPFGTFTAYLFCAARAMLAKTVSNTANADASNTPLPTRNVEMRVMIDLILRPAFAGAIEKSANSLPRLTVTNPSTGM